MLTISDPSDLQMALIADVATDAVHGRVLEVATGTPQRITVVVKDAYGGTRFTVGYVYSWYDFRAPSVGPIPNGRKSSTPKSRREKREWRPAAKLVLDVSEEFGRRKLMWRFCGMYC